MSAQLHPPSPSPSPGPAGNANGRSPNYRASMGPSSSSRPAAMAAQGLSPASPRPGAIASARPTSELLGNAGMFQTPEAEAIDQWFENLQNYEVTLEEMAAASLDVNFKEELSAIEQWFKVLSEAERTAALYSLLQHSTQVQIRFFITVLQQMARADPMTALLSPALGGSMQSQMEAKLANMSLKSPGLKSNLPSSPTARNFSGSHLNNYLSPDSANNLASPTPNDPAATLAQQRAKLNASHRISAPALASQVGPDGRNAWNATPNQLAQVDETNNAQELTIPSPNANASRPKSTDFSGLANAFKSPREGGSEALSPMVGDSWASMVNTPLIPMFQKERNPAQSLDAAAVKLNDWSGNGPGVPLMSDPPKRLNRLSKGNDDDNSVGHQPQQQQQQQHTNNHHQQQQQQQRNVSGGLRNVSGNNGFGGASGWNGSRSPALSATSGRYSDDGNNGMNGLGMGGFNGLGMGMPGGGLNMAALAAAGMSPLGVNAFGNMNMFNNMQNLAAMGLSAEQILTMQMAAATGQLGQQGLGAFGMGMQPQPSPGARSGRTSVRSPGLKSSSTRDGKKDEEDVDPKLLEDIPGWLRSLRLHKYTPNFEGMYWKDMVMMDEAALEAKGVAALGARRKMLKTFEIVRKKMALEVAQGASA
ncbi:hypothetical protein EUX98_g6526 [Antrodiella citrinella]|uniref:RNA-binding protein VTS1 n=1 Tax=Antrodiella citrinella TaxID=2447956 RepID=A0A4S4MW95_9APHY|nr:hypothetical protein EUX98_g6526 [Antrodiella citrinella]